jgi:hypothetical protein
MMKRFQVRFGQVKRKLGINADGSSPASNKGSPKKSGTTPKITPSKIAKASASSGGRGGGKSKAGKKVKNESDEDEDMTDLAGKKESDGEEDTGLADVPHHQEEDDLPDPF